MYKSVKYRVCTCILESSSTSTFCVIKMMLILLLPYQKALVTCTYKSLIEFFHGTFIFVTSSSNTNRLKYSHWLWKTNSGILSVSRHNYRLCVVYRRSFDLLMLYCCRNMEPRSTLKMILSMKWPWKRRNFRRFPPILRQVLYLGSRPCVLILWVILSVYLTFRILLLD